MLTYIVLKGQSDEWYADDGLVMQVVEPPGARVAI